MRSTKAKAIKKLVSREYKKLFEARDPRARIPFNNTYRRVKKAYKRGEIKIEN